MKVVLWIVFVGLCIKAGTVIFSGIMNLLLDSSRSELLNFGINITGIRELSNAYYIALWCLISGIMVLKADIFYKLIKLFESLDLDQPFKETAINMTVKISYVLVAIGILSVIGSGIGGYLSEHHVIIQYSWASSEYLFMAGVVFVIAQVFKRGMELQSENELTI